MNCYMGVDIGTSGCKAVVFDETAKQVGSAYREYDLICPQPGWAELDSDEVMVKCFEVIAASVAQAPDGSVCGLGISSQGEAFTPVDANGKSLCRAMVSSDTRAARYATQWSEKFGVERLYQITGQTAHPMYTLFKLLWLKDNQPDIWTRADRFFCFEDLLQYRLGLDPAIGWPLAGRTMLFDVRRHQWSEEILDAVGLSSEKLARPIPSGCAAGNVPAKIARNLGLPDDVIVAAGGHDQTCGALGAGATDPGVAMYATGTVECITPVFSEPIFSDDLRENNLCTYDAALPDMYATVAFSLTGGNILKWFRDEFGAAEVQQAEKTGVNPYDLLLAAMSDKPSGLMVLPYFTPSATPYFDIETPGAILGLRLSTTRAQIIRALLEGVGFEMLLNLDILERSGHRVSELRTVGGGAKSKIWTQLKADVMGRPIVVLEVTEAGSLGAAILARTARTGESPSDIAARWVRPVCTVQPRSEFADYYRGRLDLYKRLYPTLRELND